MSTVKQRFKPDLKQIPYLKCPVDGGHSDISEGFIYSEWERERHGVFYHKGVDYERAHGSPVYAAAAGYAVAFYHRWPLINLDGTIRTYKGKPIGTGYGFAVQITHPPKVTRLERERITQYGHLSNVIPAIKVQILPPIERNWEEMLRAANSRRRATKLNEKDFKKLISRNNRLIEKYEWLRYSYGFSLTDDLETSDNYFYNLEELKLLEKKGSPYVKWVEQGEIIGYVGDSALFWGEADYIEGPAKGGNTNIKLKPKSEDKKWDETHLHFEEAERDRKTRFKINNRDPYNLYLSSTHYIPRNFKKTLFIDIEKRPVL